MAFKPEVAFKSMLTPSPIVISVDHGNNSIKTPDSAFSSGLSKDGDELDMKGNVVWYEEAKYTISQKRVPQQNDKTKTSDFFILTLFAVGEHLTKDPGLRYLIRGTGTGAGAGAGINVASGTIPRTGQEIEDEESENRQRQGYGQTQAIQIELLTGLPPEHFKNKEMRLDLERYFTGKKVFDFKFNNTPLRIEFVKTRVYCQGFAATYAFSEQLDDTAAVNIVDIGGVTVDMMLLVDGEIMMDTLTNLNLGIDFLYKKIKQKIRSTGTKHGIRNDTIEGVLKEDKRVSEGCSPKYIEIITEEAKIFTRQLLQNISEEGLDLINDKTILVGGGAILLKKFIRETKMVSKPFFANNQLANAQGYLKIHEMLTERAKARRAAQTAQSNQSN